MDIVSNILSFGTSNARFMWNNNFATKSESLLTKLVYGDLNTYYNTLKDIINKVMDVMRKVPEFVKELAAEQTQKLKKAGASDSSENPLIISLNYITESFGAIIGKYKVAIIGVINALTGSPSGYWHIQVGNPKRPVFSSGDMIVTDVELTLGPVLSWNDLPSSITAEFTLRNARSLGADELFAKFNNSMARSYSRSEDFNQTNASISEQNEKGSVSTNIPPLMRNPQQNTTKNTPQGPAKVGPYTGIPGANF